MTMYHAEIALLDTSVETPIITSIDPTSGWVGTKVTINGLYFDDSQGDNLVKFGDTVATIESWSDNQITAFNPISEASTVLVTVVSGEEVSNGVEFTIPPPPVVSSIMPISGYVGYVVNVEIAGSNFVETPIVKLKKAGQTDITATNVIVVSASKITCTFDLTGVELGLWDVYVENPDTQNDTLEGGFTVLVPVPNIIDVIPSGAKAGDTVVITGTCFGEAQGESTLTLGGVDMLIVSWTDTEIIAVLPDMSGEA